MQSSRSSQAPRHGLPPVLLAVPALSAAAALALAAGAQPAAAADVDAVPVSPREVRARPGRMTALRPVFFETARGQFEPGWDFLVRCRGYNAFVRSGEAMFSFDGAGLRLRLRDALPCAPSVRGLELGARANYFLGDDPARWTTGVPLTRGAVYREAAPATTWRVGERRGEFDFSLTVPGTDEPEFELDGGRDVRVRDDGTLAIAMPFGVATLSAPVAWQAWSGELRPVTAGFAVAGDGRVRIELGPRDPCRPVVIDPTVSYASYVGTSASDGNAHPAIDSSGRLLLAGTTASASFPVTSGAWDTSYGGGTGDLSVVRFASSGSTLEWATYLGGTADESVRYLLTAPDGDPVVAAITYGTFPVTDGAYRSSPVPGSGSITFTRIASSGDSLVWSTFSGTTVCDGLALATDEDLVFGAYSNVARMESDGSAIAWSVRLTPTGYSYDSSVESVATSSDGYVFVALTSGNPAVTTTAGAYQRTRSGTTDYAAMKLDSSGNMVWSTLLGGSRYEYAYGIAVDAGGRCYLTGMTQSTDFPLTAPAISEDLHSNGVATISRLSANGSSLDWSTSLGIGSNPGVLRTHPSGELAFLATVWSSTTMPVADPIQSAAGGDYEAWAARITSSGALVWGTFLGGTGADHGGSIAIGADGTVAIGVQSSSSALYTSANPYQSAIAGSSDQYVLVVPDDLSTSTTLPVIGNVDLPEATVGRPYPGELTVSGGFPPFDWTVTEGSLPDGLTLVADGTFSGAPTATGSNGFTAALSDSAGFTTSGVYTLRVNPVPAISPGTAAGWTLGRTSTDTFTVTGGTAPFAWDVSSGTLPAGLSLGSGGTISGTPSALGTSAVTVRVTDANGAVATRAVTLRVNPAPVLGSSLPAWTTGCDYDAPVPVTGGSPPITWELVSGTLPFPFPNTTDPSKLRGLCGPPGTYDFRLRVTDVRGATAEAQFTVVVNEVPAILTRELPWAAAGRPYSALLAAEGGTSPLEWNVESGSLPPGCALDPATGRISGSPIAASTGTVLVVVTDACGASSRQAVTTDSADVALLTKKKAVVPYEVVVGGSRRTASCIEVTRGASVDVSVKGGGANGTSPAIRLFDADGAEIDVAYLVKTTAKSASLRRWTVPATGRYLVTADAAEGFQGKMTLTISVAPAPKFTWTVPVADPPAPAGLRFGAPPGARVAISVKPAKKSGARPVLAGLAGPDGSDLLAGGAVKTKGTALSFSSAVPLQGGEHVVTVSGEAGAPGDLVVTVTLKLPKTYDFSMPDVPAGGGD